ncbi:outer membrane protein assembly factor BamE [Morganella morganii]|nr:outer membrane protein assembly factor BamE [Morganella morganii]QXO78655.1 outer membrane protein assembly factor BamE [Morganella morganii]
MMFLFGCTNKTPDFNQRSSMLSIGMSKADVRGILGDPRRTDVNQERERWIYWSQVYYGFTPVDNEQLANDRLTVTFNDGKVVKWGQQAFADDMLEASQKSAEAIMRASQPSQK